MDSKKCCSQVLLQKVLRWAPGIPLVCYSAERGRGSQVLHNHRGRVTFVFYGEIIRYLQEYIGFSEAQITREEYIFNVAGEEELAGELAAIDRLSPRELDVFGLIGKGNGSPEISEILSCSISTVETHIKNMRGKLHLKTSVALRQLAIEYLFSGHCPAIFQQQTHIDSGRNKTTGSGLFKAST